MPTAEDLQTLLAILDEGFATSEQWSSWALRSLQLMDPVRPWIVDLLDAADRGAAVGAVASGLNEMTSGNWPLNDASLHAGLLYLGFQRGSLSISLVLVLSAGCFERVSDDPSLLFALADRAYIDPEGVRDEVAELFKPHEDLARRCLTRLDASTDFLAFYER